MHKDKLNKVLWVGLLCLICMGVLILTNIRSTFWDTALFPYVRQGKITHYFINYWDFGFVKRGLVGSILSAAGSYPSVWTIRLLALGIGSAVCCLAAYFINRMKDSISRPGYLFIAALMVLSPGTFANLGYDLGRFDQLLILCSIFSLYCIREGDLLKLALISVMGLLIHELYLIMFMPMLLYVSFYHSGIEKRQLAYLGGVIASLLVLLFLFGKIETKSVQEIGSTIAVENFKFHNTGIIWKNSLLENLRYTLSYVGDYYSGQIIALSIGGAYTFLTFLLLIMISAFNKLDRNGYIFIFLASLPIFFIAIDYSRWYSLMMINAFLFFTYMAENSSLDELRITTPHKAVILLLIAIGVMLGPIGVIGSFPLFSFF